MLYKLHTNIFIIGLLAYGFIAVAISNRAFSIMGLCFLVSFVTQMCLLLIFSQEKETHYSERTLFWTVLTYTVLLGTGFMLYSFYLDGDTFLFSKLDAMFYYKNSMKFAELGVVKGFQYICGTFKYDDWGALIMDGLVLSIIPSKLFMNAINMVLGAISSVFLFRIGKQYMPDSYAFLAALGFGTSSYMVFFHCSFLKESAFVFFALSTLYYQHKFMTTQSRSSLFAVVFFVVIQLFFRPAVAAMELVSIMAYYAITQRRNAISLFLYVAAAGIFVAALGDMQEILDSNTQGGDVEALVAETNNSSYSYGFNYFVSLFAAVFGPFPAAFPKNPDAPTWVEFYGAGLTHRQFLMFAFWSGVYMVYKDRIIKLVPIVLFVLFELLVTGLVCASLELRKVILHIPFMYTLSYYGLYRSHSSNSFKNIFTLAQYGFVIGVFFLWNVIRV